MPDPALTQSNPAEAVKTPAVIEAASIASQRPGVRTTEFWITVAVVALMAMAAVKGLIPAEHAALFAAAEAALYKLVRMAVKLQAGALDLNAYLAELRADATAGPDGSGAAREMSETRPTDFGMEPPVLRRERLAGERGCALAPLLVAICLAAIIALLAVSGAVECGNDWSRQSQTEEAGK